MKIQAQEDRQHRTDSIIAPEFESDLWMNDSHMWKLQILIFQKYVHNTKSFFMKIYIVEKTFFNLYVTHIWC
jgi:hypothetical protein